MSMSDPIADMLTRIRNAQQSVRTTYNAQLRSEAGYCQRY